MDKTDWIRFWDFATFYLSDPEYLRSSVGMDILYWMNTRLIPSSLQGKSSLV